MLNQHNLTHYDWLCMPWTDLALTDGVDARFAAVRPMVLQPLPLVNQVQRLHDAVLHVDVGDLHITAVDEQT